MSELTVLIIGNGGREHALARAIAADPTVKAVHAAPGNPGTARVATNHPVNDTDPAAVAALARELGVDLVVVGPEAPLVAGVADAVREAGIAVFGPSKAAARLEGSKAFAKDVMASAGVPTAASRVCTTPDQVAAALDEFGAPYVVKDDGLAAGKGVIVTKDRQAALDHAAACGTVVVEEFLFGPEISLFVVTDGTTCVPLQPAQDFKRVGDGDTGPNTGGMGAYSPLPWAPEDLTVQVLEKVAEPTLAELERRGAPFSGLLYCGLALTSGGIKVVEFNARFGDPETQVLMGLIESGVGQLLYAAATGTLADQPPVTWKPGAAVGVVMAADGYPQDPQTGGMIELAPDGPQSWTIQAGTAFTDGLLVASGGRVLTIVGTGDDLAQARVNAYDQVKGTDFKGGFCRTDIAAHAAQDQGYIPSDSTPSSQEF